MNNRAQLTFISIMVAIMIFISGMLFLNFLKPQVTIIQNSSNLDCDNASVISDGNKVSCLIAELVIPYFILIILSFTGGILVDRFLA